MASVTIALSVSDMVKTELLERYPWIDWSKVAALELTKKAIFDEYVKKGKLSKADSEFCDRVDWHPVDWLPLKKGFVNKLKKAAKEPAGKPTTIEELDKLFKHSKVSDEDILEWSKKARKGRFKRLLAKLSSSEREELLKKPDKLLERSELSEEDAKALEIGDKIKEGMWKNYKARGW